MVKAKILIVEDEMTVTEYVKGVLTDLKYEVAGTAVRGEEAVEKAEKLVPDLVLMDVKLKGDMDGVETAEQIRQRQDIPIIYVTAFADEKLMKRAKITDPSGYLLKPYDTRELHTAIEIALQKHKTEKTLRTSHRLLEAAHYATSVSSMLKQYTSELRKHTSITNLGIRLIREDGFIPFQSYEGYSPTYIRNENHQKLDENPLIEDLLMNRVKPDRYHLSLYGSLVRHDLNDISRFPKEDHSFVQRISDKGRYCTLIMIPIRSGKSPSGFYQLNSVDNKIVPDEMIHFLEDSAMTLGSAVQRIKMEEILIKHRDHLEELVEERTSQLRKTNKQLEKEIRLHHEAQENFKTSRASFHNIVEKSEEGIIVLDQNQIIRFINPAAQQFMSEILEKPLNAAFPYTLKKDQFVEINIRTQNDENGTGEIYAIDTKWQGEKATLITIHDITERKKIEILKTDFVSLVSHQLKTPVAEMKEFAEIMLHGMMGPLSEKQKAGLQILHEVSKRSYRLISKLLDVSRLERGVVTVDLKACKLTEMLQDVIQNYESQIKEKGLSLKTDFFKEEIKVITDRDKTVEAISNILDNAIKFTDKGKLQIKTRVSKKTAFVDVIDEGIGIPKSQMDKLFKKDQILSGAPKIKGGCGLGLYIAKEFMKLQNGDVMINTHVKKGSHFTFELPLKKA